MNVKGLHETGIKDIIDVMKDGIDQAEDVVGSFSRRPNLATSSSLNKAIEGLILVFPVLCTTTVSIETASMLSRAVERKAITILQIAFSAFNITNSTDALDFVKQFHTNIGSGKMSIDKFIDAMDSIPTSESSNMINGIERYKVKQVLEDLKNLNFYFEDDINESSIEDFNVELGYNNRISIYEAKKNKNNNNSNTFAVGSGNDDGKKKEEKDIEKERLDLEKDKFKHQKDNDNARNELDKKKNELTSDKNDMERLHNRNDFLKNQLIPSDVKKANELVPSMMIINFVVRDTDLDTTIESSAVIGIKARLYLVTPDDVINKIITKHVDSNVFLKLIRVGTREISFTRDFLLAIDDAKLNAISCSIKGSETNKILKMLERRALKGKIRRRLSLANSYKAISTLVISRDEAEYIKKYKMIDVYNPNVIRKIMEELNLMMFMIADDSEESVQIIMDTGDDMYETISYTYMERESSDGSYKKAINLMTKVAR